MKIIYNRDKRRHPEYSDQSWKQIYITISVLSLLHGHFGMLGNGICNFMVCCWRWNMEQKSPTLSRDICDKSDERTI